MRNLTIVLLVSLFMMSGMGMGEEARLLRFPDVYTDKVTFVYAGDIYVAPRTGGQAVQLTRHEGLELFPKFSPDGQSLAFTGQYDGDFAVYTMPIAGGTPKRLTFHPAIPKTSERMGPEHIVMDWSSDGQSVLFRSRREGPDVWFGRAYLVNINGGLPEALPMHMAGFTSISPDGDKVAYCPIFRDFRMWKRYKGGMAQDVWIFDLKTLENKKITDWVGTDNLPMWYRDKIYFNSDRTGTLNLFCYDISSGQTHQVTTFTDYDVRWPSLGPDGIAFENGGFIYILDLPSEKVNKISIQLVSDNLRMRTQSLDVSKMIYDIDLSPDGKRALFTARGEVFTVPAKEGNTRNLTNSSGVHEKSPAWSPNGKWIAYFSDETGEDELFMISHDGLEKKQLTIGTFGWKDGMSWSPDSKKIAYSDKDNKFYYIDVDTKNVTQIDEARRSRFGNYSWSPDSRYITYTKRLESEITAIFIYDVETKTIHQITAGYSDDYSPVFDPDGKYLYFLSKRSFNPMLDEFQFEFVNKAITEIFLILLSADEKSPFAPENDEVTIAEEKKDSADGEKKEKGKDGKDESDKKTAEVKIDFDGIYDRQVALKVPGGDYGSLSAVSGAVFFMEYPLRGMRGRVEMSQPKLHKFTIEDQEDSEFASGIDIYVLSSDRSKMLISKDGGYFIVDTQGPKASFEKCMVDISHMKMTLDRRAENIQMFNEAWRRNRDFFYDENMHGVDWKKMRDKYAVLLPYVAHRFDLTYVISEMVSELACSHTYVGGGDMPDIPSSNVGLLGADFEIDKKANRIRIARILTGENWNDQLRSPLTEPGVDVNEGDYLLAIDGKEITADVNPYSLTVDKADRLITLTVNDKPTMKDAREVMVKPVRSEADLRYNTWVEHNRLFADSASGGKIGYIHIPDMGGYGLTRFTKMFYHQIRKPAIIIDVRANGGGFVSHLVLKRLREKMIGVNVSRNFAPGPDPGDAVNAHMLTLTNEFSCSDGDIFPYKFRLYGLGPLMGKRTWGGVVGIGGGRPLLDGGYNTIPGGTDYNLNSQWVIENHGVDPDIEVDNLPDREALGYDDQLLEAITYLKEKLQEDPKELPPYPGPPAKR